MVEVYDTPSGMGGSFTVSIVEDRGDTALVRVWYGRAGFNGWEPWPDWDGYTFPTSKAALRNKRQMRTTAPRQSHYG